MELVCNTKFWLFPASHFAQNKRLYFYMDDKLVYDWYFPWIMTIRSMNFR